MPSWNIHTGLVERLAADGDLGRYGIRDLNAYLFGNLVPDVYVGYMVPKVGHTLRYIDTHYGQATHIPVPEADRFWNDWIEPHIESGGVDDVTLGAWAHLLADNHYNARVRDFNREHDIPSGEQTRIRKQSDFDLFGHSLGISLTVDPTDELKEQALRFEQYEILGDDLDEAARVDAAIVAASADKPSATEYSLLPRELIQEVFDQIDRDTRAGLEDYAARVRAAGFDPLAPAPVRPLRRPDLEVLPEPAVRFAKDPQAGAAVNTGKES